MNVLPIVGGTLIRLMLPHEGNKLLCGPALCLEVIVIRSRCPSVHHEVDGRSSTQDVSTGNNSLAATKPF